VANEGRAQRKEARLKRAVLIPACVNFDLEYDEELVRPGTSPPQQAFQLVLMGYEVMIATIAGSGFPAPGAFTHWRAARAARRKFLFTGLFVSNFLGNAMTMLMARMLGQIGDHGEDEGMLPTEPEYHLDQRARLQDFYPLNSQMKLALHEALAEFRVLGSGEPREAVAEGNEWGTEYSQALIRGEHPEEDPGLRWDQIRYARDYYINSVSIATTQWLLETHKVRGLYGIFENKVVDITTGDTPKVRALRARTLRAWVEGAAAYHHYVQIYDSPLLDRRDAVGSPT
jgi:hypothetical protein